MLGCYGGLIRDLCAAHCGWIISLKPGIGSHLTLHLVRLVARKESAEVDEHAQQQIVWISRRDSIRPTWANL